VTAGQDVTIGTRFKVTGAVDLVSPGAMGPEAVTGTPVFKWVDDSSEDRYEVTGFDSYGTMIWQSTPPRNVAMLTYGGPALEAGMYYQFRVRSVKAPSETSWRRAKLVGSAPRRQERRSRG
jgi:hypothetical protein